MAKTSASLFVPVAECLFLSLLLQFFGSGFMLSAAPVDFSPVARTLLSAQMWVSVCTTAAHAAISLLDKTLFILGDATESVLSSPDATSDADVAARRNKLASLLRLRASFRRGMDASNACCTSMLTLLLLAATGVAQTLTAEGLLSPDGASVRLLPSVRDSSLAYAASQRLSWTQAVVGGASAWTLDGQVFRVASGFEVPVIGSIFAAVLVAALGVLFLLTLYMAYVSTPEGESSLSFLDPKGLAVMNWIVSSSLSWDRVAQFEACGGTSLGTLFPDPTMDLVAAGIALGVTCFHTFIPWPRISGRDVVGLLISLAICTVQLIYIYLRAPPTVQLVCSVVAVLTYVMSIVKFVADDDRRPRSLVSASLVMLDALLPPVPPPPPATSAPTSKTSTTAPDPPSAPPPPPLPPADALPVPPANSASSTTAGALFYRGNRGAQLPPLLPEQHQQQHMPGLVDSMLVLSRPSELAYGGGDDQQHPGRTYHQQYRQYPAPPSRVPPAHGAAAVPVQPGINKFHWN